MSQDHIRVIRIYEFTGPRSVVEEQVAKSIQGEKALTNGLVIKAATLGLYPEILTPAPIPRTEAPTLEDYQEQTTGILELTNQLKGSPRRYLAEQTDDTIARFEGRWYSTTDPRRARHFYNKAEAVGVWEELCRRPLPSHLRGMTAGSFHNRAAIISLHEAQEKGE